MHPEQHSYPVYGVAAIIMPLLFLLVVLQKGAAHQKAVSPSKAVNSLKPLAPRGVGKLDKQFPSSED